MKTESEIQAERAKVQAEIDNLNTQREPLMKAFVMRRTQPYTAEQDAELLRLTTLLNLRNTQLKVLDFVLNAGSWSVLNWQTVG